MRVALVNPPWRFDGSIYFGCREPHLPLELAYAQALLADAGHEAEVFDAHLFQMTPADLRMRLADFRPDMTVLTTAPTYLFWRCAQPELRMPQQVAAAVRGVAGRMVAVGPHGSTTPAATLRKLGADAVVMGECEQAILRLAEAEADPARVPGTAWLDGGEVRVNGGNQAVDMAALPALAWPDEVIRRHRHHHHRFDRAPDAPGAEVEFSRGCPYACTFCAKLDFRDAYRRRPLAVVLEEIDRLRAQGVRYVYFVDEIFLPYRALLDALAERDIAFGVQTRMDLWTPEMIALLGRAGCVSIEAGLESVTEEGRAALEKACRMDTATLVDRLILAKRHVPFVQANLILSPGDPAEDVRRWRDTLIAEGVWANDPVPLFPYPGAPEYRRLWGAPDERAWERAVDHYLGLFDGFCDLQDERPLPLCQLERQEVR